MVMRVTPHGKLLPQQDQIGDEPLLATLQVPGSGRMRQMIAAVAKRYGIRLTASEAFRCAASVCVHTLTADNFF